MSLRSARAEPVEAVPSTGSGRSDAQGERQETRSTCPYCGVGCGVVIESDGRQITGARGDSDHPANFGKLCTKGSTLHLTASAAITRQARLLHPMRRASRDAKPQRIGWDAALDEATAKFSQVIAGHGPDAVGFYLSGQLLTEDYYVFNKLAKGLVGTNNVDTNSRLCMSSAVAGYKLTLGADAPPCAYEDVDHAGCIFIAGSNAAWAHPVLFRRIEEAKARNPAMKIVLCDPRRTDTAELADLFLPIQPGTDVMLFNGMLHLMLWEGWTDTAYVAAHTSGFEGLKAIARECTPDLVAQVCGIRKEDLLEAARLFALGGAGDPGRRAPTLSLYCQGLNQSTSGTAKNAALINLHLATGQIGKPGAGPFSLTGQPNAMGGREVGGLSNLLSAHRDLANAEHRAEVAALWGVPSVPGKPGKSAVEMFQAAADGEIKALWIACTNPAQSMPDQAMVRRAFERCEFVVVQEAFASAATCDFADLLLPATTWGEKDGTVTNSERRISRVRAAVPPPGEARHDWRIAVDFARRLEKVLATPASRPLFPYADCESIWSEHRESTRGRDLDITGMDYALLEGAPAQWPFATGAAAGKTRLYEDGVFPTPDGKARFAAFAYRPVAEPRESRYPFSLTTGRLRDQWHGMTRTGKLGRLFGHAGEPIVELHPQDMARRQIAEGDLVHVTSKRGSIVLPAHSSAQIGMSQAFIAMHWGSEFLGGRAAAGGLAAGINALTTSAHCPVSKQPELKHAAVKVLKAELPWSLVAVAWLPDPEALSVREALRASMAQFTFATCVPFANSVPLAEAPGRQRGGLLFRAADHGAPADAELQRIASLLGLGGVDTLRYVDARKSQFRAIRMVRAADGATRLEGFLLAGDARAHGWMTALLKDGMPVDAYGRLLLAAGAQAPSSLPPRSAQVCTCFDVGAAAIEHALADCHGNDAQRLAQLQSRLRCGTNCGSCIPELRRMVRSTPVRDARKAFAAPAA